MLTVEYADMIILIYSKLGRSMSIYSLQYYCNELGFVKVTQTMNRLNPLKV